VSYNASVAKIYNATGSLVRFESKKNVFFSFENPSSQLQRWRCSCKFRSRRIGSCKFQSKYMCINDIDPCYTNHKRARGQFEKNVFRANVKNKTLATVPSIGTKLLPSPRYKKNCRRNQGDQMSL
jgi:hypothetical protein